MGDERQTSIDERRRDVRRPVLWEKVEDRRVGETRIYRKMCGGSANTFLEWIADSERVSAEGGASGTLRACVPEYEFKWTLPSGAARPLREPRHMVYSRSMHLSRVHLSDAT